jgi:BUD22
MEHKPPPVSITVDEDITKNLVGRLSTAAVVKTTMNACLIAIRRAAGIEVPYEKPPAKSKPPKQTSKDVIRPQGIPSTGRTISKPVLRTASPEDTLVDDDEHSIGQASIDSSTTSRSATPEPRKRTTILPALSTGYIPASDSSDPDEEYTSFAPLKKIRKNRRGQRERQGIWLKKYGSSARHLHPELHPPKQQDTRNKQGQKEGHIGGTVELPEVVKKVNDPHPSWVAKQKLREQQKAIMNSVKVQKIVFE